MGITVVRITSKKTGRLSTYFSLYDFITNENTSDINTALDSFNERYKGIFFADVTTSRKITFGDFQ